ncbi:MAG: hypothetical protein RLZZ401_798 [Pseudomonadota bacterium]|jgi:hypothetical protein
MKKFSVFLFSLLLVSGSAFAQAPQTCEAKAVSKEGKPLAGAARNAFMKKCEADAKPAAPSCESQALSKDGKPLAGAAKASFVKKCETDAKAGK